MAGPKTIRVGDPAIIRADDHNAFVDTWRKMQLLWPPNAKPPAFSSALQTVAITESIAAAAWSGGRLTPVEVTAPLLYRCTNQNGDYELDEELTITFLSFYRTAVTVSANKFLIGKVLDGELLTVDCTENTMP